MVRKDRTTSVYRTAPEKYDAIIEDIRDCHERGQPVLVGTTSIENSELLSGMLDQGEAAAPGAQRQAARREARDRRPGRPPGAITIATNMAGRGTDIVLGGNAEKQVDA
jgi:preprotein translocase subunit SecA